MIPEQLNNMRFCKVLRGEKKPFENGWQNKGYTSEEIKSHILLGGNYGVIGGFEYKAGVRIGILDDDTPSKFLHRMFIDHFGETFQVRGHLYIGITEWDGEKRIFSNKEGDHFGELQGIGSQAVGPGSIHPSGETYKIIKDVPIKEVSWKDFEELFGCFFIKKEKIIREFKKISWAGDDIKDIPITSIISLSGMKDIGGGRYQGSHPKHGSETGANFLVDTMNNTWVCFRGGSHPPHGGGGPAELIAVMEGIIDCCQAGPSCFTGEQGREVINVAREKYGLRVPEKQERIKESMGWAKSISILKMAERNKLLNCPYDNAPFKFDDKLGIFKCPICGLNGGIKQFAEIIQENTKIFPTNKCGRDNIC